MDMKEALDSILDPELKEIIGGIDTKRDGESLSWMESQRQNDILRLMNMASIPDKYSESSFENFQVTKNTELAYETCLQYVENFQEMKKGSSLALFGNVGTGKTHLAIAVIRELIKRYSIQAIYASVLHTFEMARESFESDGINPIPRLRRCAFLVLDDLGSERPTAWTLETLTGIIDYRVSESKPMLITSNAVNWRGLFNHLSGAVMDGSDMAAARIIDRLVEVIKLPVVITGPSWRSKDVIGLGSYGFNKVVK